MCEPCEWCPDANATKRLQIVLGWAIVCESCYRFACNMPRQIRRKPKNGLSQKSVPYPNNENGPDAEQKQPSPKGI